MSGLELIKNLALLDQELAEKVEETRRSAKIRIQQAEEVSKRLLAEAEVQIRQMEEESRARILAESARLAADARARAIEEQERLNSQAMPNLDRAVDFILSKVLP